MYSARSSNVHEGGASAVTSAQAPENKGLVRSLGRGTDRGLPGSSAGRRVKADDGEEEAMSQDNGSVRSQVEALFTRQVEALAASPQLRALEEGVATLAHYNAFIENVARAHLRSPQLVAFLFAVAPPAAAHHLLDNLLEELGLETPSARPHPELLRDLLEGAGLGHRLALLE